MHIAAGSETFQVLIRKFTHSDDIIVTLNSDTHIHPEDTHRTHSHPPKNIHSHSHSHPHRQKIDIHKRYRTHPSNHIHTHSLTHSHTPTLSMLTKCEIIRKYSTQINENSHKEEFTHVCVE